MHKKFFLTDLVRNKSANDEEIFSFVGISSSICVSSFVGDSFSSLCITIIISIFCDNNNKYNNGDGDNDDDDDDDDDDDNNFLLLLL